MVAAGDLTFACASVVSALVCINILWYQSSASYYQLYVYVSAVGTTAVLLILAVGKQEHLCKSKHAHWRITPLSIFSLVNLFCLVVVNRVLTEGSVATVVNTIMAVFGLLISLLTVALVLLLPIPSLRAPTGPHKRVGTLSFNIPGEGSAVLPAQCWFPLNDANKGNVKAGSGLRALMGRRRARLWTSGDAASEEAEARMLLDLLAQGISLPVWMFHHLLLALTNSEYQIDLSALVETPRGDKDSNVMDGGFPVAVYSHGMHGWRQVHTAACEELASQGFFVFAVDHCPCGTLGRPFQQLAAALPFGFHLPSHIEDRSGNCERGMEFYCGGVDRRVDDIQLLLAFISTPSSSGSDVRPLPFSDHVDMRQIHLWGHSYGGVSVLVAALRDPRVRSVVVLDGWYFPISEDDFARRSQAQLLSLSSHHWPTSRMWASQKRRALSDCFDGRGLDLIVRETNHQNFCDAAHFLGVETLRRFKENSIGSANLRAVDTSLCLLIAGFFRLNTQQMVSAEFAKSCTEFNNEERDKRGGSNTANDEKLVTLLSSVYRIASQSDVMDPETRKFLRDGFVDTGRVFTSE